MGKLRVEDLGGDGRINGNVSRRQREAKSMGRTRWRSKGKQSGKKKEALPIST